MLEWPLFPHARHASTRELEFLVPGSEVPESAIKDNQSVLGWSKPNAKDHKSVDGDDKATWLQSFTALTDFDIARVVLAGIKTSERGRLWPATFDTNGNPRISRKSLGIPAVMKHKVLLYILVYKQKYRLHGEDVAITPLVPNASYRTTEVDGVAMDLVKAEIYTATGSIPTLSMAKEFLRTHAQDIVDQMNLVSYNSLYIDPARTKLGEPKPSKAIKSGSQSKEVIGPVARKTRKAPAVLKR